MSKSKQPDNRAAWATKKGVRLEVGPAPYTPAPENHIVIRNQAVALNPVDYLLQDLGSMIFRWLKFPAILGTDVAGEVVEVGKGVTRFQIGDRVTGMGLGLKQNEQANEQGAFQEYVVLREDMTAPIPSSTSFEEASVMALGLSTAACGLYQKDYLNLTLPSVNPFQTNSYVLIWGGSTSVGSNAIQLARSSGYEVITTCSPRNFALVKGYGASEAFDYNSRTVDKDIVAYLSKKECVGALAIGNGAVEHCLDIINKLPKATKFVSMISPPVAPTGLNGAWDVISFIAQAAVTMPRVMVKQKVRGIKTNFVYGADLEKNEVGSGVWKHFLGDALAQGKYVTSPEPQIVLKRGLDGIQDGLELLKKGVSAKKVVVSF
jgi:NADPH:quinone reductase-like Zn-dependent oxidoreductase